jgi:hypothetical protein
MQVATHARRHLLSARIQSDLNNGAGCDTDAAQRSREAAHAPPAPTAHARHAAGGDVMFGTVTLSPPSRRRS